MTEEELAAYERWVKDKPRSFTSSEMATLVAELRRLKRRERELERTIREQARQLA